MRPSNDHTQDIEELRRRHECLKTKKITAEANLATSCGTLENLKKQAREEYGTDDLEMLRAKLEQMTRENERKRAEYQEHLTTLETQLAEVEARHAEAASKESQP
jgi:hypothetical protein